MASRMSSMSDPPGRTGPRRQKTLDDDEDDVEQDRECDAQDAGSEDLGLEVLVDAEQQQIAQSAVRQDGPDGDERDCGHRSYPKPGHDHREREWQLHPEEQSGRPVAEPD